ncbi:unnamed protein product [Paramecium pentaurelia]|uniref:Uncharacterized protein n=1 Tax=Paramecium pentaurelia TaxID=43138 RepID=A0A8S1UQS8_9CILI|nr:unnamed protein product [Paramecium pentaurelia]
MNRQEKQEVEQGLRNLLEEMMIFSNDKISGIEHCNCQDLIQRISKQFRQLKNSNLEYKKLESVLQQQEADIRNHISLEQQMKLYQDGLQSKLEEANQEVKRLQQEIYKLKKSNHDGSTSYRQGSPKKQSSFSQHGGYTSHRSSCDELFKRYNKLLQQQQASISQRSNNIQISQYMMKGRQTLAEIVNIQPSRSQTKHNSSVNKSGYNNSINSEAIRNLLKMK